MTKKSQTEKLKFEIPNLQDSLERSSDFYKLMKTRRTVRDISPQKINDSIIENILKTAGTAPSGANKQPWFFCVVKKQEIKEQIREQSEKYEEYNYKKKYRGKWKKDLEFMNLNFRKPFLTEAPVLIVVFKQRYSIENGEISKNYYISESSGIALGMLFTAIHNAGLVTVPYTPLPRAFLNDTLDRPKSESALMILPIGYPTPNAEVPIKTTKSINEIMKIY
jgi:iodotyrosine deiodinase